MRRLAVPLAWCAAALVYALLIARIAGQQPALTHSDAALFEGVAVEAMAGTTAGRQALVGSAWWAPLPLTLHLGLTALAGPLTGPEPAGIPLAVWLSALCVIGGCLWTLRATDVSSGYSWRNHRRPSVLPLAVIAVLPAALRLAASGQSEAVIVPLALLVTIEGSAWLATGRLRHLPPTGFAMAGLLLCGLAAWGWVVLGALLLLLGGLVRRRLWRRLPGLLLLGWLPALYALGVWALLNRLILDDARFFVRPLTGLTIPTWEHLASAPLALGEQAALVVALGGLLLALVALDGRLAGYALAGFTALAWQRTMAAMGLDWAGDSSRLLLPAAVLLLLTRITLAAGGRNPARALGLQALTALAVLGPLAFTLSHHMQPRDPRPWNRGDAVVERVETFVRERGPHVRVFVCGYEGLGLLRGDRRDDLFVPVLDLHIEALRRDYWGQTLFLLVRAPQGAARLESITWREPTLHWLGSTRTLLAADFDDWRLFEIISAPTLSH